MSYDAYSVAVKIRLINEAAMGLAALSGQFRRAEGDAQALQGRMNEIRRLGGLALAGAGVGAAGFAGMAMLGKLLRPAEEYAHQLNIMNMAGMKQAEIADAVGAAWKLAGENLTTTATGNLSALLDLRNILTSTSEAMMALPTVLKMQTVLRASSEEKISGNADKLAFSVAKALDVIGGAKDRATFETQAGLMARVITATQGRVTPEQYRSTFQFSRQAKYGLSDEFKYEILPTLMLESGGKGGGGSRGVGPQIAALYRVVNQGYINKKSLPLWEELGYVKPGSSLRTTTLGTTTGPMKGAALEASNPFAWAQQFAADLTAHYKTASPEKLQSLVNQYIRGNQLAASLVGEFIQKAQNFTRDQKLIQGAMPISQAYNAAMKNDPDTAMAALDAQWKNLKTSIAINVVPVIIPGIIALSRGLNNFGDWTRAHPNLTKDLVLGFGALSAALAFGGTVGALTFAFKALAGVTGIGAVFAPLKAVTGAASAAGPAIGAASTGLRSMAAVGGLTGLGGTLGAVAIGLGLVVGAAALLAAGLKAIDPGDVDPMGHPGQHFIRHGRGAGGGEWVTDPTLDQTHAGEHYVRHSRAFGEWVKNALAAASSTPPGTNSVLRDASPQGSTPQIVQVQTQINLDGAKVAKVVTTHQAKTANRFQSSPSFVDLNNILIAPGQPIPQ